MGRKIIGIKVCYYMYLIKMYFYIIKYIFLI